MVELPGLWSLTPIGAVLGMLVIGYLLLAFGKVITKSSHDRELMLQQKAFDVVIEAERRRSQEWQDTALDLRAVNREQRKQLTIALEGMKTSTHFFDQVSLQQSGETGDENVAQET